MTEINLSDDAQSKISSLKHDWGTSPGNEIGMTFYKIFEKIENLEERILALEIISLNMEKNKSR